MKSGNNISLDQESGRVTIKEITVEDEEVANYISDFQQGDREEALTQAIRIGASALELAETTKEVEFVERRFEELEREFDDNLDDLRDELDERFGEGGDLAEILEDYLGEEGQLSEHLEEAFGEDGEFEERLKDELGENGEKIQQALDPDEKGTPIHRLKQEIEEVQKRIEREDAKQEVREKTHLKGYDFEDQVEEILEDIVHQTANQVEDTSQRTGELASSKKGDFVITLGETGQRIVVEAKNGQFDQTVESEMEEAVENRDADYGVLVVSSLEYVPRTKVGWFSEIDQNYVVVALSESLEDDLEPRFLKFAYHWARTRTLLSSVNVGADTDPEAVKSELDGIEDSIKDFSKIRTKCTELEDTADDIRSHLRKIEEEVMSRIGSVETELGVESK